MRRIQFLRSSKGTDVSLSLGIQVSSLKAERQATEGLVSEMGGKQAQLTAWLERNEPKAAAWRESTQGGAVPVDWDRVLPAADELSRQAMETHVRASPFAGSCVTDKLR
jgi:hypothetical protein